MAPLRWTPATGSPPASLSLEILERFARIDADMIRAVTFAIELRVQANGPALPWKLYGARVEAEEAERTIRVLLAERSVVAELCAAAGLRRARETVETALSRA
jgi:hypothetical protein